VTSFELPELTKPRVCYICKRDLTSRAFLQANLADTPDDFFCFGCGEFICLECDSAGPGTWLEHDAEAHRPG